MPIQNSFRRKFRSDVCIIGLLLLILKAYSDPVLSLPLLIRWETDNSFALKWYAIIFKLSLKGKTV